jgi:hypothetical protein
MAEVYDILMKIGISESVISVRSLANLIDRIVNPSQNNVVALRVLPWRTTSTAA